MHFSQSIFTSDSRIRTWSIRAALLMACAATVATSEDTVATLRVLDPPPAPITLTTQQGQTTRHVTVRIAPQKRDFNGSLDVAADLSAHWVPADPPVGTPPTLQVKWNQEFPQGSNVPAHLPFGENDTAPLQGATHAYHRLECEAKRECVWEADLAFTLEGEAQGHVDISEWNVEATVRPYTSLEIPEKDITISVEER